MSVDYSSYAVIGYKISRERMLNALVKKVKTRGCKHPEYKGNFCPECGKDMWEQHIVYGDGCDGIAEALDKFKIKYVTEGTDSKDYFIGLCTVKDSYDSYSKKDIVITDLNIIEIKTKTDDYLAKIGIQPDTEKLPFGLWAVLYCSY
jgi:hypothetical protein